MEREKKGFFFYSQFFGPSRPIISLSANCLTEQWGCNVTLSDSLSINFKRKNLLNIYIILLKLKLKFFGLQLYIFFIFLFNIYVLHFLYIYIQSNSTLYIYIYIYILFYFSESYKLAN